MKQRVIQTITIFLITAGMVMIGASDSLASEERGYGLSVSLGYGPGSVDSIQISMPNIQTTPDIDKTFKFIGGGFGGYFNKRRTMIGFEMFISNSEFVSNRQRPLVGGGTTEETMKLEHMAILLNLRQKIIYRIYASGGIGLMIQSYDYSYSVPVINPAHGGSLSYGAWSAGLDFRITKWFLIGFSHLRNFGNTLEDESFNQGVLKPNAQYRATIFKFTLLI